MSRIYRLGSLIHHQRCTFVSNHMPFFSNRGPIFEYISNNLSLSNTVSRQMDFSTATTRSSEFKHAFNDKGHHSIRVVSERLDSFQGLKSAKFRTIANKYGIAAFLVGSSDHLKICVARLATQAGENGSKNVADLEKAKGSAKVPSDDSKENLSSTETGVEDVGQEQEQNNSEKEHSSSSKGESGWGTKLFLLISAVGIMGFLVSYIQDPEGTLKKVQDTKAEGIQKIKYFTEPIRDKLLPDPMTMYPGAPPVRTLVLDLEDTLVHSEWTRATGWRIAKRPGVEAFLAYMSSFYEIVVFTSGLPSYANPVLDRLDPSGYVAHRLYRDATRYENGVHVKDLSKLNRDLSRVIVIDSDPLTHIPLQPENALKINPWKKADPLDRELLELIPFLESLVKDNVPDVRPILTSYIGQNVAAEYHNRLQQGINPNAVTQQKPQQEQDRKFSLGLGMGRSLEPIAQHPPEPPRKAPTGSIWSKLRPKGEQ